MVCSSWLRKRLWPRCSSTHTDLRSMTQARGSFTMKFERYEEVPAADAKKIIEAAKLNMEEEEE